MMTTKHLRKIIQLSLLMTVFYYHVTYTYQSEPTRYSCLNVKILAQKHVQYPMFKQTQRDSNYQPLSS